MKYPTVFKYGDVDVESFDSYYSDWPEELLTIPKLVVQDWIYRHWTDFSNHWVALEPHHWSYECVTFSNVEILGIDHISSWIKELDAEGVEYVGDAPRGRSRLAQHMLKNGTFPIPILVAKSAGHVIHPRSAKEAMKTPLQLIEGHSRLACLRGMINSSHPNLAANHRVWVATIPLSKT